MSLLIKKSVSLTNKLGFLKQLYHYHHHHSPFHWSLESKRLGTTDPARTQIEPCHCHALTPAVPIIIFKSNSRCFNITHKGLELAPVRLSSSSPTIPYLGAKLV